MNKIKRATPLVVAVTCALVLAATGPLSVSANGEAGTTLSATVTASAHWTITFPWTIDKSVSPDSWHLFRGDSGTSEYTIEVTKGEGVETAWVTGQVCVTNGPEPGEVATENLEIVIELRNGMPPPNDLIATAAVDVSSNPVLDPYESACYSYSIAIPAAHIHAGGNYKVTANVTITNHSGSLGVPKGPSPSATTLLLEEPVVINGTIHVYDTNGVSLTFSDSGSALYTKTFVCDEDAGQHDNTATILETGQHDEASVMVHCYALEVEKTAETSLIRTYQWTIDKWADDSELVLSTGQQYLETYYVMVDLDDPPFIDSDWAVTGVIDVHNPAPMPARINAVTDIVSPAIVASVDCGVSFPYLLPAGSTLTCTYSADLPNASTRVNTATAVLQNYDYDSGLTGTPSGTTSFSDTEDVTFAEPEITLVDTCIDVSDSFAGALGTVCYDDPLPRTFTYTRWIGPYELCGRYTIENTATFVTNDTASTGSDSWTLDVTVPCIGGCTLTQGYWKTHSNFGPAPYDDAWALVGGPSAPFLYGQSWYAVFWTPPRGGDPYYILSHQYLAAKLNILNGASSTPEVSTALNDALTWLQNNEPGVKLRKSLRYWPLHLASILSQYNQGLIGPGHCSE